ncbi:MAG: protein kinase [Thermomicrobiales bacterium]
MSLSIPRIYAGRYEITRPIGEGSFSRTFVARDTVLEREVALKVLRREHQSNDEFAARFDREAQAAARVSHPNVVSVFDFGREEGLPFIVMQYIDGRTLRQFDRDEGPLTIEEVISVGRQVLDGLASIHDQGIIHRDIKPQNVLLDRNMVARLTDFGVAFLANDVTLTQTGATIGTAAYMAPEQATGRSIGPESDLYAVGVMLYELLTRRLPFRGDNPVQVLYRHVSDFPPRPRDLNPSIPIELEAVILRALAKMPSERYPDARTMRDVLTGQPSSLQATARTETVTAEPQRFTEPVVEPRPEPSIRPPRRRTATRPPRRKRQRSFLLPAMLGVVLLVAAGVGFAMWGMEGDGVPSDPAGAAPTATEAQLPGGVTDPSASSTPTTSPTAEATPTNTQPPEPSPTLTETEEPGEPTQAPSPTTAPPPTATSPPSGGGGAPSVGFNTPFPAAVLPSAWSGNQQVAFDRDDFVEGGAYRRTDGVLYGRPAAHLYSQQTEYPSTTVTFSAGESPSAFVGLAITGMDDEIPGSVPCRILLNGNLVWEGPSPFGNEQWTTVGWEIGNLGWIEDGDNELTFEVTAPAGEFGLPPGFC